MARITIKKLREVIKELPDDETISVDVEFGPAEYTIELRSIEGGESERWQGAANAAELPKGLWLHMAIVPMTYAAEFDVGDRVHWNDPAEGWEDDLSCNGVITKINGEVITVNTDARGELEAVAAELELLTDD